MSIFKDQLMPMEIRHPERPAPMNFAFRRAVDWRELSFCRTQEEREMLFTRLKRYAAGALAEHIAQHCKWMERTMPTDGSMLLQLELTIQDRGAYENWLPRAREEGRKDGWNAAMNAATKSLPYGLADAATEFYG